jgi:CHASE3 domain sensor protein
MGSIRFSSFASKVTVSFVVVALLCLVVGVSLMIGQGEQKAYQTTMGKTQVQGETRRVPNGS